MKAPEPPEEPPRPGGPISRKTKLMVGGGVALIAILVIVLAAVWGPLQRATQLSGLDGTAGNPEEARRLAKAFALYWGPGSEQVRNAISSGRGPIEARVVLARTGKHLDLMLGLLEVANATPKQRAEVLTALAEDWPEAGKDAPALPAQVAAWIADPATDDLVAIAAAHLVASANQPDAAKVLATGTTDKGVSDARAIACAESIARLVRRDTGAGLDQVLDVLRSPHRAAIAGSSVVVEAVKNQSGPAIAERLLGMLADNAIQPILLAGLSGPRMELGADPAKRAAFAAKLAPMLEATIDDAALAGALRTIRRHQLIETRTQLLALLGRLGKHQLPGLDGSDVAEIIGGLASDRSPALVAASNELVAGLAERLSDDASRPIAAASLAAVPVRLAALVPAVRELVGYPDEPVCSQAIAILVANIFERMDLVTASKQRGWGPLLADGQRTLGRYEAIRAWMKEHADDTTVKAGKERLEAARDELSRYRDEVRAWIDATPPLGLSKPELLDLVNQIQLMQGQVTKAWSSL